MTICKNCGKEFIEGQPHTVIEIGECEKETIESLTLKLNALTKRVADIEEAKIAEEKQREWDEQIAYEERMGDDL